MIATATTPRAIEEIGRSIAELEQLRERLAGLPSEVLDGWHLGDMPCVMRLLQFFRDWDDDHHCRRSDADPRPLAKALGDRWRRDDASWKSSLAGDTKWNVIIHDAEPDRTPSTFVELE